MRSCRATIMFLPYGKIVTHFNAFYYSNYLTDSISFSKTLKFSTDL
jgi:hypothetical protein